MFSIARLAVVLGLSASSFATLFMTAPIASTNWQGGQQQTISWQESADGAAPKLADYGSCKVSIYVGNAQQQTQLQAIATDVNVATTGSIQFTPDPKIGPNSAVYFIRIESNTAKDPANPQFPLLAFSAKFTLGGMSGTFSPAAQAQIDGASTAPIGGAATSPAGSTPAAASTTKASTAASGTSHSSSGTAKPTTTGKNSTSSATGFGFSSFAVAGAAAFVGVALY